MTHVHFEHQPYYSYYVHAWLYGFMGDMISIESYLVFVLGFKSPGLSVSVIWTKHILGSHFESEGSGSTT